MTNYLFQDIFTKFRSFFNTVQNKDNKFLYDIAFGFMPRNFDPAEEDGGEVIFDVEDEVSELYFIMGGKVGVGYRPPSIHMGKKPYVTAKIFKENFIICEYYVIFNKRSEFVFHALTNAKGFAISKKFLLKSIFPKYPAIAAQMKADAHFNYKRRLRDPILTHMKTTLEDLNAKSIYNTF
jgi:hypothetical protein